LGHIGAKTVGENLDLRSRYTETFELKDGKGLLLLGGQQLEQQEEPQTSCSA